jgi:hypothetical protein
MQMSYAIDAANKMHRRQIAAATKVQDLILKAADKAAGGLDELREKAPKPPQQLTRPWEKVTSPLGKATEPLAKVFGSRQEFATLMVQSARDWAELQQKFQSSFFGSAISPQADQDEKPVTPLKAKAQPKANDTDA